MTKPEAERHTENMELAAELEKLQNMIVKANNEQVEAIERIIGKLLAVEEAAHEPSNRN